jgi:hypothetical protein
VGYMSLLGVGRGGGASPASPAWSDALMTAVDFNYGGTTYTFSGVSIGSADSDRTVIFAILSTESAAISSVSVNSGAITPTLIHSTAGGSDNLDCHFYMAEIPTGTTFDVAVTCGASINNIAMFSMKATGISASAPTGTAISKKEYGFDANPIELTLVVPSAGFGVIVGANVHRTGETLSNGGTKYASLAPTENFAFWAVVKDGVSGSQTFGVNLGTNFSGSAAVGAAFGS